jgi:dTDP-4-dehydrorhamnose 3,5-epimerase
MKVEPWDIAGMLVLTPRVFADERGFFLESFNQRRFAEAVGREVFFVQDNHSGSVRNVLRGLHYQEQTPQGKLVWVTAGTIFDVAVDLRPESPTFGRWSGLELSAADHRQVWLPEGLAHGFLVLSEKAEVYYKVTTYYDPAQERTLNWDDPTVGVAWPLPEGSSPILSDKDRRGLAWDAAVQ